jgi:hypothetical protein
MGSVASEKYDFIVVGGEPKVPQIRARAEVLTNV